MTSFDILTFDISLKPPQPVTGLFFTPTRGLFQGNPIASFLFVVVIELLAIKLRANKEIDAIQIKGIKVLLSLFADDLTLFTMFNSKSVNESLKTLEEFESLSGLSVNFDKTTIYRIGSICNSNARFYTHRKINWSNQDIEMLGLVIPTNLEQLIQKNYEYLLEKARKIIVQWSARGLSLIDKIQVVNILIYSLFVYKMSVLPPPTENILREYEEMVNYFIWNGKKAKIPTVVLKGNKGEGGLALIDLRAKEKSSKISLIFKLHDNNQVSTLAYEALKNPIGDLLWQTSLKTSDINKMLTYNEFWTVVVKEWILFKNFRSDQQTKSRDEIIWFNSGIRIQDKPIFYPEWYRKGIIYIKDLVEQDRLISHEKLQEKFSLSVPFTQYYGIQSAIRKYLRNLDPSYETGTEDLFNYYSKFPKPAKIIYFQMKSNDELLLDAYLKSKQVWGLKNEYTFDEFSRAVTQINKLTVITKLRSFQYRLLHSAILTNIRLYYMKIKTTQLCESCNECTETYEHLFYRCKFVKRLWTYIERLTNRHIAVKDVLLNRVDNKPSTAENTLILFTKYYVFKEKSLDKRISITSLINFLKESIVIEEGIAKNKLKLKIHNSKWVNYQGTLF